MDRIKQWILKRDFVYDAWLEYFEKQKEGIYQKAFKHAREDLKETNTEDINKKATELCEQRLTAMLSLVDFNHVIAFNEQTKRIELGGREATPLEVNNLKAEADFLFQSSIWRVLNETPKELAHKSMFVNSETLVDLQKGKCMLYLLDTQKKVVNKLRQYTPKA